MPLLVIDDLLENPEELVKEAEQGEGFVANARDYYPGVRKPTSKQYQAVITDFLSGVLREYFPDSLTNGQSASILMSAFSLAATAESELRPIQMLPHIDTHENNQIAVVHYLCSAQHGGTSFYRHKETGFERITTGRMGQYGSQLKRQAMAMELHSQPQYIQQSHPLFDCIYSEEVKFNRCLIYPANLLHSGNIDPRRDLSTEPENGRLTINTFVRTSKNTT